MRKNLQSQDEAYEESFDSDTCSLDLDLLNFKINYQSGDHVKINSVGRRRSVHVPRDRGDNVFFIKPPVQESHHSLEKYKNGGPPLLFRSPQGCSSVSKEFPFDDHRVVKNVSEIRVGEPLSKNDFLFPTKKKKSWDFDTASEHNHSRVSINLPETDSKRIFPFEQTPSGNFKINSKQIVFESKKLSILAAKPELTKVEFLPKERVSENKMSTPPKPEEDCSKCTAIDTIMSQGGLTTLGTLIGSSPVRANQEALEYKTKKTHEILDPELNLGRLGYSGGFSSFIPWDKVALPEKKNLYLELYSRITNYTNADCKVYIDNEEFNCHLLVLQCYSELFDEYIAVKKVELPSDKCTAASFAFIYEWMITGEPSYKELTRDNVLDVFGAAKYLKIKDLTEQCWAFIDNPNVFTEDTAFFLMMHAKRKGYHEVRELMLPRIHGFFLMLVSSQDWLDLEVDDVVLMLKSNYTCVNCEMEIFMSAVRWLKHDWANRDKHKYEVLSCVRFGNIAPWQLVDIKRNPENPDFMDLAKDPIVCKMIDDGLAFVIIKYWYGQENDDFQHWNSVLGLQEPPARNWSGLDKTYFTYREFLIYLDQYRRNQLMEKGHSRMLHEKASQEGKAEGASSASQKSESPNVSLDDFLKKKSAQLKPIYLRKEPSDKMSQSEAAIMIQEAFKSFISKGSLRSTDEAEKPSPGRKRRPTQVQPIVEEGNLLEKMFSPSNNNFFKLNMNRISKSALGPPKKVYVTENSLYFHDRESILLFGGLDPHNQFGTGRNTGKDIIRYVPMNNAWEYVGELPEPRQHHRVAFMQGRVYLVGGTDPRDDDVRGKSIVVDTVWSYDPVRRSWFSEGSLNIPRKNFGLIVHRNHLFAVGGQNRQLKALNSVEKFNPKHGNWQMMAPMQFSRAGLACAKYRGHVWAAGGLNTLPTGNKILDVVEVYNIENDQWTVITSLRFPRCFFEMFHMYDKLYIIGGAGFETKKAAATSSVSSIDIWDIKDMQWISAGDMVIPRHGHSVSYIGTQFLIIGGVTTIYSRSLNNAECFCTQRGRWVRGVAHLPAPISGHATISLPPAYLIMRSSEYATA